MEKISIGADVDPAVSALKKVDAGAKEAAKGNRDLADAIAQVNKQFQEAIKVSPGFRDALKNTGQLNKSINEVDWSKLSTNPKVAANQRSKIVNYATAGTRFQPPQQKSGGSGGAGMGFSALPIPGVIKGILALAGLGGLASLTSKSVGLGKENTANVESLLRASDSLADKFDTVNNEIAGIGVGFGVATVEAGKLAKLFSELSGETKTAIVAENTRNALALSKGFGINKNNAVGSMGRMDWMMGDKMGQRDIALIVADAISSGGMFSKGGDVMGAIERFISSSERTMVNPPDIMKFASLKALMDSNDSAPGLKGQNAEDIINAINQGLAGSSGGPGADIFKYSAIGAGNKNRKNLNIFEHEYMLEGGVFASRKSRGFGDDETTNLENIMGKLMRDIPTKFARGKALKEMFGSTIDKWIGFEETYKGWESGRLNIIKDMAEKSNIDINKVSPGVFGELGKLVVNKNIPEKEKISKFQEIAKKSFIDTKGSEMQEASANLDRGLTALGNKLIVPLIVIQDNTGDLLRAFETVHAKKLGLDAGIVGNFLGLNNSMRKRKPQEDVSPEIGSESPGEIIYDSVLGGKPFPLYKVKPFESKNDKVSILLNNPEVTIKNEAGKVLAKASLIADASAAQSA